MSLQTRLTSLATTVGTEIKAVRTLVNGNVATLGSLTTANKTNLVAAINEVNATAAAGGDPLLVWAKSRARVALVSNLATMSGTPVLDAYQTVVGDRVLLTAQTTASQNGIWVVAAGAWTRATDADTNTEVSGMEVVVEKGAVQGGTAWRTTFNAHSAVVGSTAMNWYKVIDDSDARLTNARTPTTHTHVATTDLTATGTKSSATYLRGDNTWATPPDTTYTAQSQAEAENSSDTTARLTTGQRLYQAIAKWAVLLTGTQTIGGAKTFSIPPAIAAISTGTPATDAGDGAFWYDTDDAGGTQTDAAALTTGTLAIARLPSTVVHRVVYSGGAYPARPSGATCVEWVGPVAPTMTANDTWWNTA